MNFPPTKIKRRTQPRFCQTFRFILGVQKYIVLCIDRFSKFPSAKITSSISSKTIIEFLQGYIFLHGIPYSVRVDHASCFTNQNLKLFCDSNNIKIIFCTVEDHRSNGLVEKLVHTVKIKLLAMAHETQKRTFLETTGFR